MILLRHAWLFSTCICSSVAITNFFSFGSPSAWNNEAWGSYTFSLADYAPTCGWKLIASSSYPITSISAWDSTNARFDDNAFLITNLNYNADLVSNTQFLTGAITVRGPFGNTAPNVFITWYCVCTNLFTGCVSLTKTPVPMPSILTSPTNQDVPYTTAAPHDATSAPATTSSYVTTDDTTQSPVVVATAAPAAAAATAAPAALPALPAAASTTNETPELYVGFNVLDPTKVFLQKKDGVCYHGTTYTRHLHIRHVMDCQALCKDTRSCAGINHWYNALACDLVLEDTDSNPGALTSIYPGCHYWKVVWKA